MARAAICSGCRITRSLDDLLAFWPRGGPELVRFVCRPSRSVQACFAAVVGPATVHAIALATSLPDPGRRSDPVPRPPAVREQQELLRRYAPTALGVAG